MHSICFLNTLSLLKLLVFLILSFLKDMFTVFGLFLLLKNVSKIRIADFVHGSDGLGNQNFPYPRGSKIEQSAAEFLVHLANLYPGEITVVALGPLTNIAQVSHSRLLHLPLLVELLSDVFFQQCPVWDRLFNKTLNFQERLGRLLFSAVHFLLMEMSIQQQKRMWEIFGFCLVLSSF